MKQLIGFAGCILIASAHAVDFPGNGGDIASAADWQRDTIPTGEDVVFANSGTYTASGDVSFGFVDVTAPLSEFDLRQVNQDDIRTISCNGFGLGAKAIGVMLRGGKWISSADFSACLKGDATVKAQNNVLVLTNGAAVSAVDAYVSNKKTANLLRIADGSTLSLSGSLTMGVNANGKHRLEVVSGGVLTMTGNLLDGTYSAKKELTQSSTDNMILVDGLGSRISVKGGTKNLVNIGSYYCGNKVVVSNGGVFENDYRMYIGCYGTVTNTQVTVTGGSSLNGAMLTMCDSATNGVLRIADGSSSTFSGIVYLGGYNSAGADCLVEVLDSEFSCSQLKNGYPGSRDCRVRIVGSQSVFSITKKNISKYPLLGSGVGHEFVLDGAKWHHSDLNLQLDEATDGGAVRLVGGGVLETDGGLYSGTDSGSSSGNLFYVGSDSCFTGTFVRIAREHNSVVVSNGCLTATSTEDSRNSGVRLGDAELTVGVTDGNSLVIQGRNPQVRSASDVRLMNGSTLRFDYPEDGFDQGNVPIVCRRLVIDESALRATGVAAFQSNLTQRIRQTLVRASDSMSVPSSVLAAANQDLAACGCRRCAFGISADGKELYLNVPAANAGMCIILR